MRSFIAALLLLLASPAFAGSYQDEINAFFSLYESGKKSEAVDRLYSTNPWTSQANDSIVQIKTQFGSVEKVVGRYLGKEMIGEQNIKDRFIQVTYLALYERQPVRMEFQFYRPKNDWIIYSFSFDTDFDDDVNTAARIAAAGGKKP